MLIADGVCFIVHCSEKYFDFNWPFLATWCQLCPDSKDLLDYNMPSTVWTSCMWDETSKVRETLSWWTNLRDYWDQEDLSLWEWLWAQANHRTTPGCYVAHFLGKNKKWAICIWSLQSRPSVLWWQSKEIFRSRKVTASALSLRKSLGLGVRNR